MGFLTYFCPLLLPASSSVTHLILYPVLNRNLYQATRNYYKFPNHQYAQIEIRGRVSFSIIFLYFAGIAAPRFGVGDPSEVPLNHLPAQENMKIPASDVAARDSFVHTMGAGDVDLVK